VNAPQKAPLILVVDEDNTVALTIQGILRRRDES
jgi:hypothetical protein